MVRWIYSLEAGKGSPGLVRGLTGEIPTPRDKVTGGILEASYTDAGRPPVGSLSGKATVHLRSHRLEAEDGDEIHGPKVSNSNEASGKKMLGSIGNGNFVKFAALNLAGIGSARVRVACGGPGGLIEVHAGSPTGDLLGQVEVQPTGGWKNWVELPFDLKTPEAPHTDVYLVFVKPGMNNGLMNLDWVQFDAR